jgi:hypothetical protein
MDEIDVNFSGVASYDEDILLKTGNNVVKMTLLDAVNVYILKEEVRENKQSDTIKKVEELLWIILQKKTY